MIRVDVNHGVCGFKTVLKITAENMKDLIIQMETDCPSLKPMEQEISEVSSFTECFSKIGESKVYELSKKYCKHPGCPIPSAIIKGIEVACGLAFPRDVEIKINKE